jgi:hypothetical protein
MGMLSGYWGFHPNAAGMRAVADLIIEPSGENG